MTASEPIDQEIVIDIKINKEGIFSLLDAKIPNSVFNALPELEQLLAQAIANLPLALPATKTNVGVYKCLEYRLLISLIKNGSG